MTTSLTSSVSTPTTRGARPPRVEDVEDGPDGVLMMKLVVVLVESAVKVGKGWALMRG